MFYSRILSIILFVSFLSSTASAQFGTLLLKGMRITESTAIRSGVYNFQSDSLGAPILTIEGNNITIDFLDVIMDGATAGKTPDSFKGLAILIKNGKNITIKNLKAKGYKVAVMAVDVENLQLLNSDLSYNFRQKLHSARERENFQDWMSYHNNEKDEWLRYGAAIYLKNCNNAIIKGLRVTQGQNGIMMTNCNDGLFYNNYIEFNSAIGIGMYRSSRNRIMNNQLNFNVRGYSHGFYSRGQDSAGILVYEQSNENVFAYNSATHSGDGFFLWAGQHTMDTGKGGCNNNVLYGNDFSYAPTNGIEVTFSSNKIVNNKLEGCTYGIWGGYSFNTQIVGNQIVNNKYGIGIEHGQDNAIISNVFENNKIGIQLWERMTQPGDWGYAKNRDTQSKNYDIQRNIFTNDSIPLKISHSTKVAINDDNQFINFQKLLISEKPNEEFYLVKNDIYGSGSLGDAAEDAAIKNRMLRTPNNLSRLQSGNTSYAQQFAPQALSDGNPTKPTILGNRSMMRVNEWGPYDYQYPSIWLDSIAINEYHFALLAPQGTWRVLRSEGFDVTNSNIKDAKIIVNKKAATDFLLLEMEYIGAQDVITQFGEVITKGKPIITRFMRSEKILDWNVHWHTYTDASDPIKNYKTFEQLKKQKPLKIEQKRDLNYVWWDKPAAEVPTDKFATFADTQFTVVKGKYKLILTSDDGAKLFLDGKLIMDHWNVHESAVDVIEVELNGKHKIEIEHFDAAGLSNLEFRIEKIW